tara:strand:- start:374 stop:604 length:231 start_codon:yes stop_codon:yes gene_type:complete
LSDRLKVALDPAMVLLENYHRQRLIVIVHWSADIISFPLICGVVEGIPERNVQIIIFVVVDIALHSNINTIKELAK